MDSNNLEQTWASIKAALEAHEKLVIAVEDFVCDSLKEGPRKRLEEALKISRNLINEE